VLSEDLAVRALRVGRALLDAQQAHARRNLAHAEAFLNQTHHGLSWVSPSEGAVGFVRYGSHLPSSRFARLLTDEWRTLVVSGVCFGQDHHFRIGCGGDTQTLMTGLSRLEAFIAAL
jgi:aspartate/methionine/tyrosine aminotransferase